VAQGSEREVRVIVTTAGDCEFSSRGDFSFASSNMMRIFGEDGFEAVHGFGIAVLQEQEIAGGKVCRNGIGLCGESTSEGLTGFLSLVKIEQSVAKKYQSRGVVGVLLGIWAEKGSGFGGIVPQAEMLGAVNDGIRGGIDLGLSGSLQSGEGQRQ